MYRLNVENVLAGYASAGGYRAVIATEEEIAFSVDKLPLAWIYPAKVIKLEGRHAGRMVLNITMQVVETAYQLSSEAKSDLRQRIDDDVVGMLQAACDRGEFIEVDSLLISEGTQLSNVDNAVVRSVNCDIIIPFNIEDHKSC
ncbi:MAG: hypothetical protein SNH13_00405 [Rikenellaceae bacterium]